MRKLFNRTQQEIVVNESEIEAALAHLRALPFRTNMPLSWDRNRLLMQLREAIGDSSDLDRLFAVGPGLYAILMPYGVDRSGCADEDPQNRLEAWLLIRPIHTLDGRQTTLRDGI